jgi:thioredoxin-like negative regulator of GroEL
MQTLHSSHFQLAGNQQKTMFLKVPGNVLVLFTQATCHACNVFMPTFNQLANHDRRISYAVIDLTSNRDVIGMSRQTSLSIQNTPMLLLYSNGKPCARFTGSDKSVQALSGFISKALTHLQQQQPSKQAYQQQSQFVGNNTNANKGMYGQQMNQPQQQRRNNPYQVLGSGVEEEDDDRLLVPTTINPKNEPWSGMFKEMATLDN